MNLTSPHITMGRKSEESGSKDGGGTFTTGNSTTSTLSAKTPKVERQAKTVSFGRYVFLGAFFCTVAVMGFLSYFFLEKSETAMVNDQYNSLVDNALLATKRMTENKLLGATTMARVAGYTYPDAESWPMVVVPGWYSISETVVATSLVGGLSLAPIVYKENVTEYEALAKAHYDEVFPGENAGNTSMFGFGIWSADESKSMYPEGDKRYHDTTGETSFSPYNILVPKLQHSKGNHPLLMMNVHGFETQGLIIDTAINCTYNRAKAENPEDIDCQSVSDLVPPKDPTEITGPGAYVATPIYPANEPLKVVGMIFAKMNWNEVLEAVFAAEVTGIDCVVQTEYQVFTYTILDGIGTFLGEGDLHDPKYDQFGGSMILLNQTHLTADSVEYTMTFYPNDDLADMYRTSNPRSATIGAVLIMLFTAACFFVYDYFVRNEFQAKSNLLTAKRQFVRYVSHEVRTPLNSVVMGLTLLQEEIALSMGFDSVEAMATADEQTRLARSKCEGREDEWFQLAGEVQTNAASSVDVLNDLLNYDKIESGTLSLELSVIKIWDLIEQTVAEFKLPAATKKITLDLKLNGDKGGDNQADALPFDVVSQKVIGDSVRITQVVRNLISNALKFTPETKHITVTARWRKRGEFLNQNKSFELKNREVQTSKCSGELVLSVRDTGAGMTREQLGKLFGQGVQFNVNELQAGNGSGLGLYIAKGIAEQHEGTLVADSEGLGLGTTFTLTVPLYEIPDEKEDIEAALERKQNQSKFEIPKLRVLIVDDAATNRKLLGRLLKLRGHTVDEAEDGHLAVEKIKTMKDDPTNKPFELVLMDYEMPTMNGPTAASEIRKLGSDVFIVGITGNMMAEDVEFFTSSGANAVLPKPFKMTALEDLIVEYEVGNEIRDMTKKSNEEFYSDDDDDLQRTEKNSSSTNSF